MFYTYITKIGWNILSTEFYTQKGWIDILSDIRLGLHISILSRVWYKPTSVYVIHVISVIFGTEFGLILR